ncbi:hypothetical protein CAEBREN_18586 [Caenorhabditis brenneri]|uniref:Secreted protein n=1 Tax=Caenorhabditis brenneri TaxID=135651 RepID=G0N117_CAEBE|nr:hypothetical protein CAEBREN_18586 [Caenorhabditis brenneri]
MIALFSLILAFLAPQASAVIGGDLNCTSYNGTATHVSTVKPSPTPNASLPNGEPSLLPTAHPPVDSVTLEDVLTPLWTVLTTVPFAMPSDSKTL